MTRTILLLGCLLSPAAIWGQASARVPEPISAPWPLADLAFTPQPLGQLQLIAVPNPIAKQGDAPEAFLQLTLDADEAATWIVRATRFVDSVLKAPRDLRAPASGLSLRTGAGSGRITLAHQPAAGPNQRFLLVLTPAHAEDGWSVQGGSSVARGFLRAFATAVEVTERGVAPDSLRVAAACERPDVEVITPPHMALPTQKRLGGRALMEFVVDPSGTLVDGSIRALLSSGPEYTAEAVRNLREMRFGPGQCDGVPANVVVQQGFAWIMTLRH